MPGCRRSSASDGRWASKAIRDVYKRQALEGQAAWSVWRYEEIHNGLAGVGKRDPVWANLKAAVSATEEDVYVPVGLAAAVPNGADSGRRRPVAGHPTATALSAPVRRILEAGGIVFVAVAGGCQGVGGDLALAVVHAPVELAAAFAAGGGCG